MKLPAALSICLITPICPAFLMIALIKRVEKIIGSNLPKLGLFVGVFNGKIFYLMLGFT